MLRADFRDTPMIPTGGLLNEMSGGVNAVQPAGLSSFNQGIFGKHVGTPETIIGTAVITDDSNLCQIPAGQTETDAPCGREGKYAAVFRYHDGNRWQNRETVLRIDAGGYHNGTPGQGNIPIYGVGDVVPAFYDQQRLWCIPIQSPPDRDCVAAFRGQTNQGVPRGQAGDCLSPDAAEVHCQQFRSSFGNWKSLTPKLIFPPMRQKDGHIIAQCSAITVLHHMEEVRLACVMHQHSRAVLRIPGHGIDFRFIAKLGAGAGSGVAPLINTPKGVATLGGLAKYAESSGRFIGSPAVLSFGNSIRVAMASANDEWLVELTWGAEVIQDNLTTFAKIKVPPGDSSGNTLQTGEFMDPIEDAYHDAILVKDHTGAEYTDRTMRIWLSFIDRWSSDIVAGEQGRVYGPVEYAGIVTAGGEERPLYVTTAIEEEYFAKTVNGSGTMAKDTSESFLLYYKNWQPSKVTKNATSSFGAIKRGKRCVLKRMNGFLVASQAECGS